MFPGFKYILLINQSKITFLSHYCQIILSFLTNLLNIYLKKLAVVLVKSFLALYFKLKDYFKKVSFL
jgi:hypothetical protein